jgi:hypothetical protein
VIKVSHFHFVVASFRFVRRIINFNPDRVSVIAHTFTSTNPSGGATARVRSHSHRLELSPISSATNPDCSDVRGGLAGIAALGDAFASRSSWGIGGGCDSFGASRTGVGAMTDGVGEVDTGDLEFATEVPCRKVRRSSSTDESRASKSSTLRFVAFALAIATNGSTTIKIRKAMRRRIKASICLLDLAAYCEFGQDDTRFARRLLIVKNFAA